MPSLDARDAGRSYWRSLDELAQTPDFRRFVENEFPSLAAALESSPSRRQFLKLMGASLGLAGVAACRWPEERILPYTDRPRNRIPGSPVAYATAMELDGAGTGLLVQSFDGRPIKVEGNDRHPFSLGRTNSWHQASVLQLYDPDRSQWVVQRTDRGAQNRDWDAFWKFAQQHFRAQREQGGATLCVLAEASDSPTFAKMKRRFRATYPQARWYEYEPVSRDNEREGLRQLFGRPCRPQLNLDQADVIVTFADDFLMLHPAAVRYARQFAARRRAADGKMNRLYAFETTHSVTGGMADHRAALRPRDLLTVLHQLQLAVQQRLSAGAATAPAVPEGLPISQGELERLAQDLVEHRGRAVLTGGPGLPPEAHAVIHQLNHDLGAVGRTLTYFADPNPERPSHTRSLAELASRMQSGQVGTLVVLGGNPVYTAPAELKFAEALAQVETTIHLGLYQDQTAQRCAWHVPRAHYLETWGDVRAWDGTVSIQQPLIAPFFGGRSPSEMLAWLTDDGERNPYALVQRTFREEFATGADWEAAWKRALHDGIVADTAWNAQSPRPQAPVALTPPQPAEQPYDVVFMPDYSVYDGRFANNGWLQEMPDPLTKVTWDNAALLSPADARALGVAKYGDLIRIEFEGGGTLEIPAYPLPGHARGAITLPLGYGHESAGVIARGAGFNVYPYRGAADQLAQPATRVAATGRHYALATTQDHHAIESEVGNVEKERRAKEELIRTFTLPEYLADPDAAKHKHLNLQLWEPLQYDGGHRWGMAIDLSACTGCSACVVACQAENNIPVVGKDEVYRGREMHWIRVDRYFKGEPTAPHVEVAHQPMTCHHCENAPCEQVCPVAATVHDTEGLNVMVYNRCIGTRYCNNNCPFKVRRFNWFYNHHGPAHPRNGEDVTPIEAMVFNPDVTVRSRGVMEKCSFCVQRINQAKIEAKTEGWPYIPDETFTSACAQACPTDAIAFGDLQDPDSSVSKLQQHSRSYELLGVLHLRSRLKYLARLKNPIDAAAPDKGHGHDGDDHGDHAAHS